jgi:hypothetical protein
MFSKRMKICIALGAILGVVCIIGASIRSGFESDVSFLFALWYNRLIMGIMIGLASRSRDLLKAAGRGALFGLLVSFAFYASTGFSDIVSFLAGIIYGMIIETFAFKYGD